MSSINPSPGSFSTLAQSLDDSQPVVMVNLMRFKEFADYSDGVECSGQEAYKTYSKHTRPLLEGVGGEVVYFGQVAGVLIAPEAEQWDQVLLVRYPNFSAFVSMVKSEAYGQIVHHRTAALSDSRLIATQPGSSSLQPPEASKPA
ncbi:MAG: DUF1330 domain-containing protein [Gammaproteobacteria bacterium]